MLIDGFHRLEAHKRAGRMEIDARVLEVTAAQARLFASEANSTHGLQLEFASFKAKFAAYLNSKEHVNSKGKTGFKSLREMAADIGVHKNTVRKWLCAMDHDAAVAMGLIGPREKQEEVEVEPELGIAANHLLDMAEALFELAKRVTPEDAGRVADSFDALATMLRNPLTPVVSDF